MQLCIHFGCARARASRRTWCLAARELANDRAHPGPPTPCCVATECKDTPEVERMTGLEPMSWPWRGLALPAELHPQKMQGGPSASTGVVSRQVVKERPQRTAVRSLDRRPAPVHKPVGFQNERGPDPFGAGPLRTEIRGRAVTRFPLPDVFAPRPDQAAALPRRQMAGLPDRPDARPHRKPSAIPSPQHVRTRPDH